MMITELVPAIDGRKSFYYKAVVHSDGPNSKLYSYTTLVASHENGKTTVYLDKGGELWSATTWRHIREYLYGIHGKVYTKKEAIADFAVGGYGYLPVPTRAWSHFSTYSTD